MNLPRLVVPAYFHPAQHPGDWRQLASQADEVAMVVLNPASGPGSICDTTFLPVLDRLRADGVTIAGYVDTDYGHRTTYQVLVELGRYLDWYRIDGALFDRAASGPEHLTYYAALARHARALGIRTVGFNHGAHPVARYADVADLLGTFEGPWRSYVDLAVPRWVRAYPAGRFFHLVHTVPPGHLDDLYALAERRNVGGLYATDLTGANPWRRLPGIGLSPRVPL
jgi:hypothetical protein